MSIMILSSIKHYIYKIKIKNKKLSSAESQKVVNTIQRSSFENEKGAIAVDFVQQ